MTRRSLRLGQVLRTAGITGVVALAHATMPVLQASAPFPMPIVIAAVFLQSGLLLGAAVWVGVVLGPQTGLDAILFR